MQKPLAAFTPHGRSSRNAFSLFLSVFLFHLNPLPFDHPPPSLFFVSPFLLSLFPLPPLLFFLPVRSKGVCRCAKLSIFVHTRSEREAADSYTVCRRGIARDARPREA